MQEVLKRQRRVKDQKEDPVVIESEEEGGATSSRRPQLLTTPKTHSRPASKMASPMPDASSPEEPTPKRSRITTKTSKKTVEQIYQKKTQLEHILLRPDSYVGSVERQQLELWTLPGGSSSSDSAPRMLRRKVDYVPALYKIFDEILVNAADNLIRDPSMNTIKVDINKKLSRISVWNNGRGLPVQVHKEHRCYVPTLVFGHLLTSDNYDDSEKKVVGGRNGYGAKLTNIYSKRFIVETADSGSRSKFRQRWGNNMRQADEPEIVPYKGKDFTAVSFEPDLQRFGMTHLEDDIVALMERRAYDVAASTRGRCEVFLNGKCLEVDSFEDYVSLFLDPDDFRISEACNERWEVAIALTDGSGFRQVSFVNSICTSRGGTHVNCVAEQVVAAVMEELAKEKGAKGTLAVKPQHVKNHLWVFVNCLIENPAFDSQTKETLTTKKERFGSTCELSEELLQAVCGSGIVETLLEWSKALGKSELARHLNKSDLGLQKRLFGIPKLEDANKAGTKQSRDCTLIITEGDSAKALAVAGLSIVGRDHYGVFPLRGKLRNVRELTEKQMMDNKEIEALMKIMAFDASKKYQDASGLRYGSLMIMTDQDFDGSHIKGLVINFIEHWFPDLLQCEGFLREFVTPIVKVSRGDEVVTFFTVAEYEAWKQANNGGTGWACKYYKGLGTSTSAEAREYFSDLEQHELTFLAGEKDNDLIDMAFHPRKADARKEWIGGCSSEVYVDHSQPTLSYDDFVNKELVHWAKYDVERAIPSLVDGLKPGQRKVLFGTFLKKLTHEMKVAQLSGFVAEKSAYHHGETSLQGTIIAMAQHFVGSNNVNLLLPCGQFGTRNQGGKDHAAPRYIFTKLSPAARCIFPAEDDPVLEYQSEEGQRIEPRWYCPVIPLVLVNGSEGIGVGWSTSVPNYNPRDLIANVRRHLRGEPLEPLTPWYRGFRGTVTAVADKPGRYETVGVVQRHGSTRIEVTELPVRKWTQDYKEWIMDQLQADDGKRATISEFREYHTENTVHFSLSMLPDKVAQAEGRGLEKFLHLKSTITTTNMHLFDASGKLKKYESPEEILRDFAKVRLELYGKRKEYCIQKLQKEVATLTDKAKFIRLVVDGELEIADRASRKVCNDMKRFGLRTKQEIEAGVEEKTTAARNSRRLRAVIDVTDTDVDLAGPQGYEYLLKLKLWTLTEERLEALQRQLASKSQELEDLKATSREQLWERDLVRLEAALDVVEAEERKEQEEAARLMKKAGYFEDDASVNRQCVLVVSDGFSQIKRIRTDKWKAVQCGGAGKSIAGHKKKKAKDAPASGDEGEEEEMEADGDEELPDAISAAFVCREFDALLAFTRKGFVFRMQALDVPLMHGKRPSVPIAELAPKLPEDDCIASVMAVPHGALKDQGHEFAVAVSANGLAKKIPLSSFRSLHGQKNWTCAFPVDEKSGDELRWVHRASAQDLLVMTAQSGYTLCFSLAGLRPSRTLKARPVPAMRMKDEQVGGCGIASVPESVRDDAAKPEKAKRISGYNLFCKEAGGGFAQASAAWSSLGEAEKEEWHAKARAMNGQNPDTEEAPPPASTGPPRKRHVADDDDSDNEEDDERLQSSKQAARNSAVLDKLRKLVSRVTTGPEVMQQKSAKADPEDDDEEAEMDDARSNVPTEVSPQSPQASPQGRPTGAVSASMQQFLEAHSVLLVSDDGFGKRVRLSDIKLASRNKTGKRVKLQGDGNVVAVCVVPSDELPQLPPKPREAAVLYKESCTKARAEAVQEAAARGEDPEPEKEEAPFESLSAKKQKPYFDQQQRDQQHFEAAQKERLEAEKTLRPKLGEVLLCTSGGSVLRLPVMRIRVMKPMKRSQGRLMKVQSPDTLVSASLMSSVDDEKDGATVGEEQKQDAVQEVEEDEGEEEEEEEEDDE